MTVDKTSSGKLLVECECGCIGTITHDDTTGELKISTKFSKPKQEPKNGTPKEDTTEPATEPKPDRPFSKFFNK